MRMVMSEPVKTVTKKSGCKIMEPVRKFSLFIILVACLVTPVFAGTNYLDGSPDLGAYINGTNEYAPGADIQIPVVIENNGVSLNKNIAPDVIDRADLPATAKFVTVGMSAGTAPLVIKSDPRMIGDISSQARKTVIFHAKVSPDAPAGTYPVPLNISWSRVDSVDQDTTGTFRYYYVQDSMTLTIPLVIRKEVIPEIVSVTSDHLIAGEDGYVNLRIKNAGSLDGADTVVKMFPGYGSPVTPADNSVFVGDFPAGGSVSCQYRVSVARDAEYKTYPVGVMVVYRNNEGDTVTSKNETVGVSVGSKTDFAVTSSPAVMNPGITKTIQVTYKNTGNSAIRSARAKIKTVEPFTSSTSDVADLGDLAPGQSVAASFQLNVAGDATIKEYGLDSEIRYLDGLHDTHVSDPLKVTIDVQNLTGFARIVSSPFSITVIAAAVFAFIYVIRRFKKKNE